MAKNGMKRSDVHAKAESASKLSKEQQDELARIEAEDKKNKEMKKKMMKETGRVMFGIYTLVFAGLSYLIDFMGILAGISLVLGIIGMRKLKEHKDKYYWFTVAGSVLAGIRLVWEIINILKYFLK